jgi:glutamate carboxypeptidase
VSTAARSVLRYLEGRRSEMVSLVEALASVESPSTVPESQVAAFDVLESAFRERDLVTLRVPGRASGGMLYARPRGRRRGQPVQLLIGHIDTVWPIGTLPEMPLERGEDMLRGPGVYDMKAGLAMMVFALEALAEEGLEPAVLPLVFVNSDEEVGSRESARRIRTLARLADRALVLEPSMGPAGIIKTARKGVGRYTLHVRGKAAHAGLDPEAGASAILELSHQIQRLFQLNDPARGVTVNVGTIDGGLRPNVIAPESKAVVDVRVATHADGERIHAAIHALAPVTAGVSLRIEGSIGRPPMEPGPRDLALWAAALEAAESLGLSLEQGMAGGGSDGNTTSQYTATLDGLGAVGDGAHAHHEFIFLDRLPERTALLAMLLMAPPLRGNYR